MSSQSPEKFRMTFTGHLDELRKRLVICVVVLLAGMAVSYAFRDVLLEIILQPLFEARRTAEHPKDQSRHQDGHDHGIHKITPLTQPKRWPDFRGHDSP